MAAYNKFNAFVEAMAEKKHNIGSDVLMVALTNVAPVAANSFLSDITQIAYTNLSTRVVAISASSQTGGVYTAVATDLVLTSTGGPTGPFRYVVIYNNTNATDATRDLISWYDRGDSITLAAAETLTLDFGASLFSLT